jgi:predicted nucleotidyltransferase
MKKVLYFVKYYLDFTDLDEQRCTPKKLFASANNVSWIELPYYPVPLNVWVELAMNLDTNTSKVIQKI